MVVRLEKIRLFEVKNSEKVAEKVGFNFLGLYNCNMHTIAIAFYVLQF